ncbi:hypothetical protein FXO09_09935 [Microcystis aeruginosa KLA2]|nr:hypothetical protein FXO09_09935 [Microcystis aeruginosa KLA2]
MCMVRSQKSIGGTVGLALGNAPYGWSGILGIFRRSLNLFFDDFLDDIFVLWVRKPIKQRYGDTIKEIGNVGVGHNPSKLSVICCCGQYLLDFLEREVRIGLQLANKVVSRSK